MSDATPKAEVAKWGSPLPANASGARSVMLLVRNAARDLVPYAQYQLRRLGPAGILGAVASVAAAVIAAFALLFLQAANDDLNTRILRAQHRYEAPITPEQGLTRVVTQLPTRAQMPAVLGQVLQQAHEARVELAKGSYSYRPAARGEVGSYELDFPVTAQYPAVRDFINRILTNLPSAGLRKLTIQRKVVGDPQVNADVRFVIFVRER